MAVSRELISITFAVVAVLVLAVPSYGCTPSGGKNYTVGDAFWSLPPSTDYYASWSSSHSFNIGDSLVFDFNVGRYDLMQVTKQDYDRCTAEKPLRAFGTGPVTIPLREKGVFYYICSFSNYCARGQKISIAVNDCPCAATPPLPPSPPPSSSPSPPPVSPPHVSSPSPSPAGRPSAAQPPYGHYSPSPAPWADGTNGSPPHAHSAGSAPTPVMHKGMCGVGCGLLLVWTFQLALVSF